jgi:hypothetical protein
MTPDTPNPASAAARTGSGKHHKRLASDVSGNKLPAQKDQAPGAAPLRLLAPPTPPPRPRRRIVHVTISAVRGREPIGRTRPLMLRESDLAQLVEAAERLEALA